MSENQLYSCSKSSNDDFGRICVPTDPAAVGMNDRFGYDVIDNGGINKAFLNFGTDLIKSLPVLLGCMTLCVFFNLMYIKLMSTHPEMLAKVAVVMLNIMLLGGIGFFLYSALAGGDGGRIGYFCAAAGFAISLLIFDCALFFRYKYF